MPEASAPVTDHAQQQKQAKPGQAGKQESKVLFATAGYDHTIRFWEVRGGVCYRTLQYAESQVNRLCFSPDGSRLVAAGAQNIRVYDAVNNNVQVPVANCDGHTGNVTAIGYRYDGRWIWSASEDGTLRIWEVRPGSAQGIAIRIFKHGTPIGDCVLHPNQAELVCADYKGSIMVYDIKGDKLVHTWHTPADAIARCIAVNAAGQYVLYGDEKGKLNLFLWDWVDEEGGSGSLPNVSNVGTTNATQAAGENSEPSVTNGNVEHESGSKKDSENNQVDETSASQGTLPNVGSMHLSKNKRPNLLASVDAHESYVLRIVPAKDPSRIATTSADLCVKLWKIVDEGPTADRVEIQPLMTLRGHQRWVWDATFSIDSAWLLTASSDHHARLWNLTNGETVRCYSGHQKAVTCCALSDQPVE
eukprot:Clim_evm44s44 gene=Clim_evmTU44s44